MCHRFQSLICALLATAATATAAEPNIRVCAQLIEVSHPDLTEILAAKDSSGPALHRAATTLIRSGEAKLIDSSIIAGISKKTATVESVQNRIYPTEQEGHYHLPGSSGPRFYPRFGVGMLRAMVPADWNTRNVGMTFEMEPDWDEDQQRIRLRMAPEWVGLGGLVNWVDCVDQWGDGSCRRPSFTSLESDACQSLVPGQFAFVAVLTPQGTLSAPQLDRKVLLFVRADIPKQ